MLKFSVLEIVKFDNVQILVVGIVKFVDVRINTISDYQVRSYRFVRIINY